MIIDPQGAKVRPYDADGFNKYYPDGDFDHTFNGTQFKAATTNIYKTKDGRFFHLHGLPFFPLPHLSS